MRRTEFIWAVAAFAGVMLLGTLKGILVAIIISLVALAQQVANPPVYVLGRKRGTNAFRPLSPEHAADDEIFPGLLMLRLSGRLFFANAARVAETIRPLVEAAKPAVVALDLSGVFDLEYTALKMLDRGRGAPARARRHAVARGPDARSARPMVQRSPLGHTLGQEAHVQPWAGAREIPGARGNRSWFCGPAFAPLPACTGRR